MGLNVDLSWMLKLPTQTTCPKCHKIFQNGNTSFDIECGDANPAPGIWEIGYYCPFCEHEFTEVYTITLKATPKA